VNTLPGFVRVAPGAALALCVALFAPALSQAQQTPEPPAAAPPAPAGDLFTIPKVIDRPLGLEEGPRLRVTAFRLSGAVARDQVNLAEVNGLLAAAQASQPAEGFAINQLQEVAGQVTKYYRDHGLILAQAFIPAQEVSSGEVTIQVLEGKLGAVRVEGNKYYDAKVLTRPFRNLIGGPVVKDQVEESLLRITGYAGLNAQAVFSAGSDVGTTDLVLRVQQEQRLGLDASVDNHGSRFSGEYRGTVGLTSYNAFGIADTIRAYALRAFDPNDNDATGTYGGITANLPMTPSTALRLEAASNAYDVGLEFAALGLTGETFIATAAIDYDLVRSRYGTHGLTFDFSRKTAKFEESGSQTAEDEIAAIGVEYRLSQIDTRFRGINRLSLRYTRGLEGIFGAIGAPGEPPGEGEPPPSRTGVGGGFHKTTLDMQRMQRLSTNMAILVRAFGQYSDDLLTSLEQLSLGGPYSVRAYPVSEFLVDRGAFASFEFIANAPGFASRPAWANRTWGQVLQFSLFADYATGKVLGTVAQDVDATPEISGWGGAVQFNFTRKSFLRADVATPIGNYVPSDDRDPQYFVRFGVQL